MPPLPRWALGLGMTFLSGVLFLFSPAISNVGIPASLAALTQVLMAALALAAGIVLSDWRGWSALALADAAIAGGLVTCWTLALVSSSSVVGGGLAGLAVFGFVWFIIFGLAPILVCLLIGIAIGALLGMTPGQPNPFTATQTRVARWVAALIPVVAAGFLASSGASFEGNITSNLGGLLVTTLLAISCLLAGWLLRSWWGAIVTPVVYLAVMGVVTALIVSAGGRDSVNVLSVALYVALPAVVMSAIGTALGMYQARRSKQRPRQGQPAI